MGSPISMKVGMVMKGKTFLVLALTVVVALASFTMAQPVTFVDMPDNWATDALEKAVQNALLEGYEEDGVRLLRPDGLLTRAEMAAVVVRAFGAQADADLADVIDVDADKWYAGAIAKAVQMGVLMLDTLMRPEDNITRQEVFVVLSRAIRLVEASFDLAVLDRFEDKDQIADWALADLAVMTSAGYIQGYDRKIFPRDFITRAEFAVVMDNLLAHYITEPGTVTEVPAGNVLVRCGEVTLKDVIIQGDLIISDGVGDGKVTLDNVTVKGRIVIRSGEVIVLGDTSPSPGGGGWIPSKTKINSVTIEGEAVIDGRLSALVDPPGATVTYRWQRAVSEDGAYADIDGATENSYSPTEDDGGKWVRIRVTGTGDYTGTATSAPVYIPSTPERPKVISNVLEITVQVTE